MKKELGLEFILIVLVLLFSSCQAAAQEYTDKESKELNFGSGNKVFIIENIFGGITIEGVAGNKGLLETDKTIYAESKADLEKAKNELKVKIENFGDTVLVYLDAPFIEVRRYHGEISYHMDRMIEDYRFHFDFTAKIPKDAEIIVSTINDGDVYVDGISGKMKVRNINGSVELKNILGQASVSTVNGKIVADFQKSPQENCKFKTINGDISIFCDKNLSADVNYKSMNGEFFTNYSISSLEPEIVKETKKIEGSTFYKIGQKPRFRIGNGKIKMSFETLNGDMTIKYKE